VQDFKCIQRIFCIDARRIEQAVREYPDAFHGGITVVTYNSLHNDDPCVTDYETYCRFFRQLQAQGVEMQVGLSTTLGHGDDNFPILPPYPTMVSQDGCVSLSSACPRSEAFKTYFHDLVTRYAVLKPKVFWIDDDFRLYLHQPVNQGCFCDDCMAKFNAQYGFSFDRSTLSTAISQDLYENGQRIRSLWQEFSRQAMLDLVKIIAHAVHSVDEDIIIGFMQVNPEIVMHECPHFSEFVRLAKNRNGEVWFRHGSGFYSDRDPLTVVAKNVSISRLCAMTESIDAKVVNLTEEVTMPYILREKSMRITLLEAAMNIGMAGADGVTDEGIKPNLPEQLLPGRLVSTMHENYPYLARMHALIQNKHQIGVYPWFSEDLWLYNDPVASLSQMGDLGSMIWLNLFHMGIPFTFRKPHANVLLLSGQTVRAIPDEELLAWLKKGVYMDGTSALEVNARTDSIHTGVCLSDYSRPIVGCGNSEHFTDHPLNGSGAGYDRHHIWGLSTHGSARLQLSGGEALSYSMNAEEARAGIIGSSIYQNELGGRIAVQSRAPWSNDVLGLYKTQQIKNTMDWLCGGRMPVQVCSSGRMGCCVWEGNDGERIVFIYNTDFDDASDAVLRTDAPYAAQLLLPDDRWQDIGSGQDIPLPMIPAWSFAVLRLRKI